MDITFIVVNYHLSFIHFERALSYPRHFAYAVYPHTLTFTHTQPSVKPNEQSFQGRSRANGQRDADTGAISLRNHFPASHLPQYLYLNGDSLLVTGKVIAMMIKVGSSSGAAMTSKVNFCR